MLLSLPVEKTIIQVFALPPSINEWGVGFETVLAGKTKFTGPIEQACYLRTGEQIPQNTL